MSTPVLELKNVDSYYGKIQALEQVSASIYPGEIVTMLGSNGAGKSTLLKTISGLVKTQNGSIIFLGQEITKLRPHEIVELGVVHVPEGRRIFGTMTVLENLELGGFTQRKKKNHIKDNVENIFELFPRLKERAKQKAGTLSGGEQQMLAIGRGLMVEPKLLMLDEPSMGLAPIIVKEIMKIIRNINKQGTPILLVEQNVRAALKLATRGYVLETGILTMEGSATDLQEDSKVVNAYLA
ncbi:ABC transporter ATP-binding protein [Neobacillus niacini]|uniref:ABC transporter ATP-binding protein n=1 Tax=Neobacillus niacini TaxID=86668 RepID=UPI0028568D3B|nr:ABC transporter ATP-binding protein [Neobacillus niacini]MDR7001181.1 branched-chain amino acid transport system ATP-binding protein [Neobacillus niacini]